MKLLIIDDHTLFRQGLSLLISELDPDIELKEVGSCHDALNLDNEHEFSLILLDLYLPQESPLDQVVYLSERFKAPVVMLSSEDDNAVVLKCIEHGAAGFVPKSSTPQILIAALQLILAGGTYLPPNVLNLASSKVESLDDQISSLDSSEDLIASPDQVCLSDKLSVRQREVLIKAVQGKANKVIARELSLSEGTIKAHMSSAYRALGVKNRTEAVYLVAKHGLKELA